MLGEFKSLEEALSKVDSAMGEFPMSVDYWVCKFIERFREDIEHGFDIKIGVSGAAGSGKTTFVNTLAEKLRTYHASVGVVREVARDVFNEFSEKYGVKTLAELREKGYTCEFQMRILYEQVKREEEAVEQYDIVICDRTLYDNFMYTLMYCKDLQFLEKYVEAFNDALSAGRYDFIFLCEPIPGNVDDGFRTPDLSTRKLQHELMKAILPYYTIVPATDVESRIAIALASVL